MPYLQEFNIYVPDDFPVERLAKTGEKPNSEHNIKIGYGCTIRSSAFGRGRISIGNDVCIEKNVSIGPDGCDVSIGNHAVIDADCIIGRQPCDVPEVLKDSMVRIGSNAIIGAHSTIDIGVYIGEQAIVFRPVQIGCGTMINHGCILGDLDPNFNDWQLMDYTLIKPISIGNFCTLDCFTRVESGFLEGTIIEDNVHLGAYCLVRSDAVIKAGTKAVAYTLFGERSKTGENGFFSAHTIIGADSTLEPDVHGYDHCVFGNQRVYKTNNYWTPFAMAVDTAQSLRKWLRDKYNLYKPKLTGQQTKHE